MSWIKKLFQMFMGEGAEEGTHQKADSVRYDTNQNFHHYLNDRSTVKKEPEARVLYQYPKGQFKFPLIPDSQKVQKPEFNSQRSKKEGFSSLTSESSESKRKKQESEKPVQLPKPTVNRQPFRPTETPSPVFAFSRPKQEPTPTVEYELNGFLKETPNNGHDAGKISTEGLSIQKEHSVFSDGQVKRTGPMAQGASAIPLMEQKEPKAVIASFAADLQIEGANKPMVPDNEDVLQEPSANSIAPKPEVAAADTIKGNAVQENSRADWVKEDSGTADADSVQKDLLEEQSITDKVIEVPETKAEGKVLEDTIQEFSEGTQPKEESEEVPAGMNLANPASLEPRKEELREDFGLAVRDDGAEDSAMQEKVDQESPGLIAAKEEGPQQQNQVFEEPTLKDASEAGGELEPGQSAEAAFKIPEGTSIAEGAAPKEEPSQVSEETQRGPAEEPAPERPKRHLPFNVLMLKQDKKKLGGEKKPLQGNEEKTIAALTEEITEKAMDKTGETETNSITEMENSYQFPGLDLLKPPVIIETSQDWLATQEQVLNETLKNFNVGAKVVNVTQGPTVTRFEVQPEPGVKVNKITNLSDDIKLSLAARDIRMEAPIPGKHTIGIEVPNETSRPVLISEILRTSDFSGTSSPLAVALGLDIAGKPIVTDLKKMPHGLIAGATGSGKSVCINTMLVSLLYKAHPDDVKLLLIDPKMVELAPYNHIPHLVSPVITDVKAATASLKWAVEEMERRYELFAHAGVRDIGRFNELALEHKRYSEKLPYIVIVIDELADLMMMSPADVEEAICRIAQKARACGIHLIIATQRPSVDVITGLIKANVPTRIAFSVSSQVDSRTIIDISGAEKLLGHGDMLFLENGSSKPYRLQGTFVSDQEIDDIVAYVRKQRTPEYLFEQDELIRKSQHSEEEDELFYEACEYVIEQGGASTSSVQRRFKVGYNRAARLIEMMEQHGFISEGRGSKPRDVLISAADLESFQETSTL